MICDSFSSGHTSRLSVASVAIFATPHRRCHVFFVTFTFSLIFSTETTRGLFYRKQFVDKSLINMGDVDQMKDSNIILTASPFSNIAKQDVLNSAADVPMTVSIGVRFSYNSFTDLVCESGLFGFFVTCYFSALFHALI